MVTSPRTTKRPMALEDSLRWKIAAEPQMSPDGTRVVCTLTIVDEPANGYQTHLWIVPVEGGAAAKAWQLTTARARESSPRWSPDGGSIAFISDRGGAKQIWATT